MFEGLRKHSQSFFLVILIASLATVFGISFGPGSRGCSSGQLRVPHIARVYGSTVSEQDFRSLARLARMTDSAEFASVRQAIVDRLIERELLAHEAERLGFNISEDEVNREIRDGFFYNALGSEFERRTLRVPTNTRGWAIYSDMEDRQPGQPPPPFNYDDFESWVRRVFGRTVRDYKNMMAREMLAQRMREVVMNNVTVSEQEAWERYRREHESVAVRYIEFSPEFYRTTVRDDDPAALEAFIRGHQNEINQQYEQRRESLRNLPLQVRVRHILLRFPDNAEEPARLAVIQRAQALRAQITGPGGDFVRAARLYSQDDTNWRSAGMTGWLAPDRVDVPADVQRVIPNLQVGQISEVIRSPIGAHIIQLVDRRQGDVAEADAKRDIARDLFVLAEGERLAQEAAARAQQALAQGSSLDAVGNNVHAEALRAFYHGEVPGPLTLPGNNVLEPVNRDVGAPELRETQAFHRGEEIPGIENSDAFVQAAFQLRAEHPAPDQPVVAGEARYLMRLKDNGRQEASRDEFNRERLDQMARVLHERRRTALEQYLTRLRQEAERSGNVRIGNSPLIQQRRDGRRGDSDEGQG